MTLASALELTSVLSYRAWLDRNLGVALFTGIIAESAWCLAPLSVAAFYFLFRYPICQHIFNRILKVFSTISGKSMLAPIH